MTRAIAILLCLLATLFLVPVQGECSVIPEYESETEIECCVVVNGLSQLQVAENLSAMSLASDFYLAKRQAYVYVKIRKPVYHLPARLLNCVFRE